MPERLYPLNLRWMPVVGQKTGLVNRRKLVAKPVFLYYWQMAKKAKDHSFGGDNGRGKG